MEDFKDPKTGIPVYSIYGSNRKPSKKMLEGLDIVVYDIQDIGSRSYTFISTLGLVMRACAENGIEICFCPACAERADNAATESRTVNILLTAFIYSLIINSLIISCHIQDRSCGRRGR